MIDMKKITSYNQEIEISKQTWNIEIYELYACVVACVYVYYMCEKLSNDKLFFFINQPR